MSNEHSILHQQPTWHTPTTTETMKSMPHSGIFQHLLTAPDCFQRATAATAPGVDLTLTRNGGQNGEAPPTPISLSVRDANKINSLPASVLDMHATAVELTKCTSPGLKAASPGLKSVSPGLVAQPDTKQQQKRSNVRVDSILERLNPNIEKTTSLLEKSAEPTASPATVPEKTGSSTIERIASFIEKTSVEKAPPIAAQSQPHSVIVQASSSHDENSNSSGILNVPTPTNLKEEDAGSTYSNEDSLDSQKSRRKRKPCKTVRVSKDDEKLQDGDVPETEFGEVIAKEPKDDPVALVSKILEENKVVERRRSSDDMDSLIPVKTRRKTSSEPETIDDIAALVQECVKEKHDKPKEPEEEKPKESAKPVSVIRVKDNLMEVDQKIESQSDPQPTTVTTNVIVTETSASNTSSPIVTPAQKKATNTQFVEVENKLEEMFAGIEDADPVKNDSLLPDDKIEEDPLMKLEEAPKVEEAASATDKTLMESDDIKKEKVLENGEGTVVKKTKRKYKTNSRRGSDVSSTDTTPKKRKQVKKLKKDLKPKLTLKGKGKRQGKVNNAKAEAVKDVYAYDSGSNASSNKSRGPFIQIKGPRDSPLSVNVVNAPLNDDDTDKRPNKTKKYHDDSEYRHKVRTKGLHCSTLSNKYDSHTKDASWICAFCKRGPHATELSGPTSNGGVVPAGDLFGPYFITTESAEYENRLEDPYDRQFKSRKITKALDESAAVSGKLTKKGKRKHTDSTNSDDHSDIYLGITDTGNQNYEIWAHEDCIVWSPGIYLVGHRIVGLEEAIWTSCNVRCKVCHLKGANMCCNRRGCLNTAHLCCARSQHWHFDGDAYKVFCPLHWTQ